MFCYRESERSAATWQRHLAPFSNLEFVVSDGARGIATAVRQCAASRRPDEPALVHGLDVFHTLREASRILATRWRQAEKTFAAGEAADELVARAQRKGDDARRVAGHARGAWSRVTRQLAEIEDLTHAYERAREALEIFRPDGQLNDRAWAESELAAVTARLAGPDWRKFRKVLCDHRTLTFLDRMHQRLAEAEPDAALRAAMVWRWRLRHRRQYDAPGDSPLGLVESVARNRPLDEAETQSYRRVADVLETTVRASSCVEGMNSVLRMQQGRHRKMTQRLLDLKRLYWNTRPFQTGARRGKSPYQLLSLSLPSHEFWQLLNSDLAQPTQKVSIYRVAG
jgi:hypothetical protein